MNFATTCTSNFYHKVLSLNHSLSKNCNNHILHVICIDKKDTKGVSLLKKASNLQLYFLEDLLDYKLIHQAKNSFKEGNLNILWALKAPFLHYLIKEQQLEKVLFCDNDIYLFNSPKFLFDELNTSNILLTPHWFDKTPDITPESFELNFQHGLYNAGFIGVNKKALKMLKWWANVCAYKTELEPEKGYFVDQRYLDLVPIYFNKVKIIKHQGCNIGSWNTNTCSRILKNNKLTINLEWNIIFIHFTHLTMKNIASGEDGLLQPFLDEYLREIKNLNPDFQI